MFCLPKTAWPPTCSLKWDAIEGYSPVVKSMVLNCLSLESGCLRVQPKVGGTLLLRLSIVWEKSDRSHVVCEPRSW